VSWRSCSLSEQENHLALAGDRLGQGVTDLSALLDRLLDSARRA
jgi:hypothetical protein